MATSALEILQHALGVDGHGRGEMYREHFVAGPGHDDYDTCMQCVADGLMTRHEQRHLVGGVVFIVTDAGRQFVRMSSPPPPKLTRSQRRYERWLGSGAADAGMTFGGWLRGGYG